MSDVQKKKKKKKKKKKSGKDNESNESSSATADSSEPKAVVVADVMPTPPLASADVHTSGSGDEDDKEDTWSGLDDEEVEEDPVQCLFCNKMFADGPQTALSHAARAHDFDFHAYRKEHKLDFYGSVRLINFIRTQIATQAIQAKQLVAMLKGYDDNVQRALSSDDFLKPFLADDALLFSFEDDDDEEELGTGKEPQTIEEYAQRQKELQQQVADLQDMIRAMRADYQRLALGDEPPTTEEKITTQDGKNKPQDDRGYFDGYSHREIHEVMLKDEVRTLAYRDFIHKNANIIKGKIVLDIGCGTGILSLFAAKAGAAQVIAIDNASIIEKAKVIAAVNGCRDKIKFIRGKVEEITDLGVPRVEEITDLGVPRVDIIISEWMGYFLHFESMLPSVLVARDRWLRSKAEGGRVFPNLARLYMAGFEASEYKANKVDFWKDVYGFDMTALLDQTEQTTNLGSHVEIIKADQLITSTTCLRTWNCEECKVGELDFAQDFLMECTRDDTLDGFVSWFDVEFSGSQSITMTTAPAGPPTHWKQTTFYLAKALAVKKGDKISGRISASRRKDYQREYDVHLQYSLLPLAPAAGGTAQPARPYSLLPLGAGGTAPPARPVVLVQEYCIA
eukprot:g23124.t1